MEKEKKEIWKLIELLNEFETPQSWIVFKSYDDYDGTFYWVDCDGETEVAWSDSLICSKKFWWIWWLVENDKIDRDIMGWKSENMYWDNNFSRYERLLMILSISDTPIEDLINYLK